MAQVVHIPYRVGQDEDDAWRASALLCPGIGAVGDDATPQDAITDLRDALRTLLEVVGPPSELNLAPNSRQFPALSRAMKDRCRCGGKREPTD